MKILMIHNRYAQQGGEDYVYRMESELLAQHGHFVDHLVFDNSCIRTMFDKFFAGLKAIYNPESARALKRMIENFKPDIIHIHNLFPLISPSVLFVAHRYCIPVVLTLHNFRLICPSATLFHKTGIYEKSIHSLFPMDAIWRGVYRNSRIQTTAVALMTAIHSLLGTWKNKVDLYITLTQFAKDKFINSSLSIPEDKLIVKPNTVKDFGNGESDRKDSFLFVGRLVEEKGIRTLLEATKLLNFKLTIIGDGPLRELVCEYARHNTSILYMGLQDKPVVVKQMKSCRALIFPSLWYEGFPVTLLEAFSTGTLVIGSRLGGIAEIIQDNVNGLLFEAGSEKDLVHRIIETNNSYVDKKQLSRNARSSFLRLYTPENNYSMLMRIYKQAQVRKRQSMITLTKNEAMPQLTGT